MNEDDNNFKVAFSSKIPAGGSVSYKIPVPKELEAISLKSDHERYAIEYYIASRFAYFKKLHSVYLMNCFWCVEHLLLAILVLRHRKKGDLKKLGGYHQITKYWPEVKDICGSDFTIGLDKFDNFISQVQGHFVHRYPSNPDAIEVIYTNKPPVTRLGENSPKVRHGTTTHLDINKLDHFVNFFLIDITGCNSDASGNLMEVLASIDSKEIYVSENKYSIIYPNRQYEGEFKNKNS